MVSRRAALRLGVLAALVPMAACTSDSESPQAPDPLAALAAKARSDAALASAIADARPDIAAAATEVAKARTEHAKVLQAEVDRLNPPAATSSSKPPAPEVPADGVTALDEALASAEKAAADLVPSVEKHRAGLLGSVAAGCASLRVVLR